MKHKHIEWVWYESQDGQIEEQQLDFVPALLLGRDEVANAPTASLLGHWRYRVSADLTVLQ